MAHFTFYAMNTSARFPEMTYNVLMGMLNYTHSLTHYRYDEESFSDINNMFSFWQFDTSMHSPST